jgi:hypothetical protein
MQPSSRAAPWTKIAAGDVLAVVSFASAIWAMSLFWPGAGTPAGAVATAAAGDRRPALTEVPPLKPAVRSSTIITPAAIALTAIGDALERTAPRDLAGKRDTPIREMRDIMSNSEIAWTVARGPLAVAGRPDGLAVSTALNGIFRVTGQLSGRAGDLAGMIGNLLGGNLGRDVQNFATKPFDQRADIRGTSP